MRDKLKGFQKKLRALEKMSSFYDYKLTPAYFFVSLVLFLTGFVCVGVVAVWDVVGLRKNWLRYRKEHKEISVLGRSVWFMTTFAIFCFLTTILGGVLARLANPSLKNGASVCTSITHMAGVSYALGKGMLISTTNMDTFGLDIWCSSVRSFSQQLPFAPGLVCIACLFCCWYIFYELRCVGGRQD